MAWWSRSTDIPKLKARRNVEGLITALKSGESNVIRVEAARALGEVKDPQAVSALVDVLGERCVTQTLTLEAIQTLREKGKLLSILRAGLG